MDEDPRGREPGLALDESVGRQRTLYVTPPTHHLRLRHGHVAAVDRDGDVRQSVPVDMVGQIVVVGPVGVSAGLRAHLLRHGPGIAFLSRRGRWQGCYASGRAPHRALRRAQFDLESDPLRRLARARQIVAAKIIAQRTMLRRYRREGGLTGIIGDLTRMLDRVRAAGRRSELLGLEGAAAARHFDGLALLIPDELGFGGRSRRPPTDVVNAALSFGYTLLLGEAHAAVAVRGLDAWVGVLHEASDRAPALALDLMEELRVVVVDTAVVTLCRRRHLMIDHQRSVEGGGIHLTVEGRRRVIRAYEGRMQQRFTDPPSGTQVTWRRAMMLQAGRLAAVIRGVRDDFPPVGWR